MLSVCILCCVPAVRLGGVTVKIGGVEWRWSGLKALISAEKLLIALTIK